MDEVSPRAGLKHLFFQKHGKNHRFSEVLKDAPWSPSAVKTNYRNYRSVSLTLLLSNNQAGLFRQCLKHVLKAMASTNSKYLYSRYYVPDPRTVLLLLLSPLFTEAEFLKCFTAAIFLWRLQWLSLVGCCQKNLPGTGLGRPGCCCSPTLLHWHLCSATQSAPCRSPPHWLLKRRSSKKKQGAYSQPTGLPSANFDSTI